MGRERGSHRLPLTVPRDPHSLGSPWQRPVPTSWPSSAGVSAWLQSIGQGGCLFWGSRSPSQLPQVVRTCGCWQAVSPGPGFSLAGGHSAHWPSPPAALSMTAGLVKASKTGPPNYVITCTCSPTAWHLGHVKSHLLLARYKSPALSTQAEGLHRAGARRRGPGASLEYVCHSSHFRVGPW